MKKVHSKLMNQFKHENKEYQMSLLSISQQLLKLSKDESILSELYTHLYNLLIQEEQKEEISIEETLLKQQEDSKLKDIRQVSKYEI